MREFESGTSFAEQHVWDFHEPQLLLLLRMVSSAIGSSTVASTGSRYHSYLSDWY